MESQTIIAMMKAKVWEEAKGKLRAFVAIQGSYPSTAAMPGRDRHNRLQSIVEKFISIIEDGGLQE